MWSVVCTFVTRSQCSKYLQTAACHPDYIENLQLPSGALPWFADGITDPWDHVEALMGLTVAGRFDASLKGFEWLSLMQRNDGAWYAAYQDEAVADNTRAETNFVAYVATGIWHYCCTGS